jgi:hypothetical protein
MTAAQRDEPGLRAVERFQPTSGVFVGRAGLLLCAVAIGYVALSVHTVTGLRVGLAVAFFGILVWMTQLRSRATVYPDRLLLRNSVRDAVLPLALIDEVSVRQTLNVWVGDRRYVCVGIGSSLRSMFKESRRSRDGSSLLGAGRWREFAERAERAAPDQSAMSYETFVVTRIEELVEQAKKAAARAGGTVDVAPTQPFAWPEIVALTVTGVAFVVSLFL